MSAADSAFASLTVGVAFTRNVRFEQQRKIFEQSNQDQQKTMRAAPVIIASDGSIVADPAIFSSNNTNHNSHGTISIQSLLTNLPPTRLDFISKSLTGDAAEDDEKENAAKKNKNGDDADGEENNATNDDDDKAAASAVDTTALKPAGRKHIGNYLTKHDITVKGTNFKSPGAAPVDLIVTHFSEIVRAPLNVSKQVVGNLFERNLQRPTVIQSLSIPLLIAGRNVLACAPTGSGKTIAFLVPMLTILKKPSTSPDATVRALIVAPTKELAAQIERESQFLMKGAPWRVVHYGHTTKGKDVFITTPQRAVSMAESNVISLTNVQYIVFDEGDKLWEQGSDFGGQVKSILAHCGVVASTSSVTKTKSYNKNDDEEEKESEDDDDEEDAEKDENNTAATTTTTTTTTAVQQDSASSTKKPVIAFFSATLPPKAEKLARSFMPNPVLIVIKGRANTSVDCDQKLVFTGNELGKITAVKNMVNDGEMRPPVLIFVQSIERSKELYDEVRASGLRVAVLNAQLSSDDRDKIVLKFRMGEIWVLITTELLARGVDFKGVATVINFDLPLTVESYVHRVGRTARAGKRGTAITFFTEEDKLRLPPIVKVVSESGNAVAPYLLELKQPTPKQLRHLERSVPNRLAVSTKKRMRIGEDRIMRMAKKFCKTEEEEGDQDGGDEDFGDDEEDGSSKKKGGSRSGSAKKKMVGKRKIPNSSKKFE